MTKYRSIQTLSNMKHKPGRINNKIIHQNTNMTDSPIPKKERKKQKANTSESLNLDFKQTYNTCNKRVAVKYMKEHPTIYFPLPNELQHILGRNAYNQL